MAPPADFDLAASLTRWRESLGAHEALTPERVRELETHLRDSLAEIRAQGITANEAFWVAARRVGDASSLAGQFVQADPASVWRTRVFWMLMGLILVEMVMLLPGFLRLAALEIAAHDNGFWQTFFIAGMVVLPIGMLVLTLLTFAGLAAGRWPILCARMESLCSRRGRFAWPLFLVAVLPSLAMIALQALALVRGEPAAPLAHLREMLLPAVFMLAFSFAFAGMAAAYAPRASLKISA
jgi:hypothetical protein